MIFQALEQGNWAGASHLLDENGMINYDTIVFCISYDELALSLIQPLLIIAVIFIYVINKKKSVLYVYLQSITPKRLTNMEWSHYIMLLE